MLSSELWIGLAQLACVIYAWEGIKLLLQLYIKRHAPASIPVAVPASPATEA